MLDVYQVNSLVTPVLIMEIINELPCTFCAALKSVCRIKGGADGLVGGGGGGPFGRIA